MASAGDQADEARLLIFGVHSCVTRTGEQSTRWSFDEGRLLGKALLEIGVFAFVLVQKAEVWPLAVAAVMRLTGRRL